MDPSTKELASGNASPTVAGVRTATVGALSAAAGVCFSLAGCSAEEPASASSESSFTVLTPTASASSHSSDTTGGLPDPAIWETPQSDPFLEKGRLVWSGTCIDCHSTGLGGAPLIGNRELWGPRVEKGLDTLVGHALEGFYGDVGEMPARGGNQELSDEDVRAAVTFMASRID